MPTSCRRLLLPFALLSVLLVALPACGNRVIRPFKKKPRPPRQEQPERPPSEPPAQPPSEPSEPPSEPPAPPPSGLAVLPVPPPSRNLPEARPGGQWYEAVTDTLAYTDGPTNLLRLFNTGPAGAHGFLQVRGEEFVFEDGTPFRFWGTNLARGAPAPTKEEAPKIAAQLARLGFNAVRLHLIDSAQLLFNGQDTVTKFNRSMLDRLDFFLAELKKKGIYYDVNLYVWRRYGNHDPVPTPREIPEKGRYVNYFHPDVVRLEKDYTRRLLTHKNPYTGLTWAEDPAMAMIELSNENSLFGGWFSGYLDEGGDPKKSISKPYRDWLDRDWNRWLKERYRTTAALKKAWSRGAGKGRIGLAGRESLEQGNIARVAYKKLGSYSPARIEDMARYYYHLETHYIDDYRDFLRRELKVKVPVLNTQNYNGLPGLAAQAHADWVDTHAYWDHPQFKGGVRNQPLMKVHQKSLVQNPVIPESAGPGGRVSLFNETAMSRIAGKPYTITEWAPSKANPYAWEVPLIFGAYNAFHGTNGMYLFAYASERDNYHPVPMANHLQWSNVYPFLIENLVAALAWRRGDVSRADRRIELHYSDRDIFDVRNAAADRRFWWGKPVPPWASLRAPIARVLFDDGPDTGPLDVLRSPNDGLFRSSTGELLWDARQAGKAFVRIDTPRYQAVIGSLQAPEPAANLAVRGDGRAAVAVISLDHQPLARSGRALLTAVAAFRFQGEKVTAASGGYQQWDPGRPPLQTEAVRATVELRGWSQAGELACYALDWKGGRAARVPVALQDGRAVIELKRFPYPWFELVAE